jgi:GTP cyclohydrolase I
MLDYDVAFIAEARADEVRLFLKTAVPVTSLCPCSKSISRYGAHNQRTRITIKAELDSDIAAEEFFRIAEEEASCELWGLLKRPDEKFVTEHAYENPKFVEDLVRDVALRLNVDTRVLAYVVEAESIESIHNHNAYAMVEYDKRRVTDVER